MAGGGSPHALYLLPSTLLTITYKQPMTRIVEHEVVVKLPPALEPALELPVRIEANAVVLRQARSCPRGPVIAVAVGRLQRFTEVHEGRVLIAPELKPSGHLG